MMIKMITTIRLNYLFGPRSLSIITGEKTIFSNTLYYASRYALDKELNPGPSPEVFDDMLFDLVEEIGYLADNLDGWDGY